jgi:cathepsin A (carboxypeptidase C)
MLIVSNADMMCNYMGNERWLDVLESSFQSEFVAAKHIPWVNAGTGEVAGSVRSAGSRGGNVTFVTVFEAGYAFAPRHLQSLIHVR